VSGSGVGSSASLQAGASVEQQDAGDVFINSGASVDGVSGVVTVMSSMSHSSGHLQLLTGSAFAGMSGDVSLRSGSSTVGSSGSINMIVGQSSSGNSGSAYLLAGTSDLVD
jgi:hypothetical protein